MALLSVIVAVYNEEDRLPQTIDKLKKELEKRKIDYEIIVSNDGSIDDTVGVAKRLGLKVVGYAANRGFTTALRYGFKYSVGDVILNLPADVDDFGFLDVIKYCNQFDVVSISKRHPDSVVTGYNLKRWLVEGWA